LLGGGSGHGQQRAAQRSAAELIGKVNGGESGVERRRIRRPTRAGKSIQSGLSAAIDGEQSWQC
jgi:hypothetical protein